jgi:UrcA family protein
MSVSHKWVFSLAAAAAVSLLSVSANAAESVDDAGALSKRVKTWDLNLAKSADVQTLNARVHEAAKDVCLAEARRHRATTRRAPPNGWRDQCVNDAVEAAVREVGNRRLALDTTRAVF